MKDEKKDCESRDKETPTPFDNPPSKMREASQDEPKSLAKDSCVQFDTFVDPGAGDAAEGDSERICWGEGKHRRGHRDLSICPHKVAGSYPDLWHVGPKEGERESERKGESERKVGPKRRTKWWFLLSSILPAPISSFFQRHLLLFQQLK